MPAPQQAAGDERYGKGPHGFKRAVVEMSSDLHD
jgi:hypothetical protein